MLIPCREIANVIENELQKIVETRHASSTFPLTLVAYLLGDSPEQLSFVTIKKRLAQRLGIGFDFTHYTHIPRQDEFAALLRNKMNKPESTGVIIQHPLPTGYDIETIYNAVPSHKEIEGHKADSTFQFPLSLAVLTGIKYIYAYHEQGKSLDRGIIVEFEKDKPFFKEVLGNKKIVIAGRGSTGGKPIAECLSEIGLSYTIVHSQTSNTTDFFKEADIIITATGKPIIDRTMIKKGVILLNVGLRKEEGKLKGDYTEEEIQDIASYYTQTPGGLGPLDVLYLYKNLLDTDKR